MAQDLFYFLVLREKKGVWLCFKQFSVRNLIILQDIPKVILLFSNRNVIIFFKAQFLPTKLNYG